MDHFLMECADDPLTVNPCCCMFVLKIGVKGSALLVVLPLILCDMSSLVLNLGNKKIPFLMGLITYLAVVEIKKAVVFGLLFLVSLMPSANHD